MLSTVLRSPRAVQVNIEIMRAFVRLRQNQINAPSPVEQDFKRVVEEVKQLEAREKKKLPAEPRNTREARKGRHHEEN